ncbi:hypothetical protein HanXRQr2_Chr12g0559981 [Helianthus annuus]|uniref:Uncharacterized protein n=1 Tax=Helianthus annuus TaxID=4232 RepID=A0A9K3MXL4_HELAN|nr:hypothetical protein HanXRQr2_Chr12g0559981 [Helianthus annuus]KAJ0864216.1 hypothetical protein HanPSC8_Chr12g0539331 [Helianthus annuus]
MISIEIRFIGKPVSVFFRSKRVRYYACRLVFVNRNHYVLTTNQTAPVREKRRSGKERF